jgi:hypothetical protein
MRAEFSDDPAGLRFKAKFFQRIACDCRTILVREELEGMSMGFMDEATALERDLQPKKRRPSVLRVGKISLNNGSVITCLIRQLTYRHASLELTGSIEIPSMFELSIPGENWIRECQVCWKKPPMIGVSFVCVTPIRA